MEIKYTNFYLDSKVYGKNELCGMVDKSGVFLEKSLYDVKRLKYNPNKSVNHFLKFGAPSRVRAIVDEMLGEYEMSKEHRKRKLGTLSESELIKVLSIRAVTSSAKTIILDSIDAGLNWKDLNLVLKTVKRYLKTTDKTAIFSTHTVDNIIVQCDRYMVIKNEQIIYNDKNFDELPEPTETVTFAELANKRGAKIKKYKDANDLLKAIYRSVK